MTLLDSITFGSVIDAAQTVALVVIWLRKPGQDAANLANATKGRVAVLEERLSHMPTGDDVSDLDADVRAIKATMSALVSGQEAMRAALVRVETYLLNHKAG